MNLPLEREAILPRIDGIRSNLTRLRGLGNLPFPEFVKDDPFALAQHYLRLTLEGVFHIGGHILSRLPGGRAVEYKEIARKLGAMGVVSRDFSEQKLVPMAGLRNLLVHDYAHLDAQKIYTVIKEYLNDIDEFLRAVKAVCEDPKKFGLTIE